MKNVELLRGDPRKAIKKMSIPLMIGGLINALYNFVDGIWVAGLGPAQLAAVGLFMPFMIIISSLANGVGVGGSSAIARSIGRRDKKATDHLAEHTMILGVLFGVISGYSLYPFLDIIFKAMGATDKVATFATAYGHMILIASPLIFVFSMGLAILRGEGDTKRPMYLMIFGSVLNMILDPIFIYTLGFGVVGAAFATVISITLTSAVIVYWLIFKKESYSQMHFHKFKFRINLIKDILKVGIPSSLTQMSASFSMIILNAIIISISGTSGMAAFSAGWRVVMLGVIPIWGISSAAVSVFGNAYGEKNIKKLKAGYKYGVKYAILTGTIISVLVFIFAPQLAYLFSYSKNTAGLSNEIITLLRYISIYFAILPIAIMTSGLFKGIGWGLHSLAITITRTLVTQPIFAYLLAIWMGLIGVWIGIDISAIIVATIAGIWAVYTFNRLHKEIQYQTQ